MTYKLKFVPSAQKEWNKLAVPIKRQFKEKLAERLQNPLIPSAKLRGYQSIYKIKLRNSGYRLVYEVAGKELVVYVIAIGKRDKSAVYKKLSQRK